MTLVKKGLSPDSGVTSQSSDEASNGGGNGGSSSSQGSTLGLTLDAQPGIFI
jgi:hypothetical protein